MGDVGATGKGLNFDGHPKVRIPYGACWDMPCTSDHSHSIPVIPLNHLCQAFVVIKWVVIGKYKAGRYPIGGQYYLRWWFVDICRKLFLRGIWGSSDVTLRWYYRMLGAKIEKGARISLDCNMAEYDLVYVGRNSAVELCTLRGFGVDNGCMLLGIVRVGRDASVGLRSVVAPNTSVPDGQHLGPGTSTYDDTPGKAWSPRHARVNRKFFPEPNAALQLLFGLPLHLFVSAAAQIPPMAVTYGLLYYKSRENSEHFFSTWNELMDWLCDPRRIPFFLGIRVARALLSPFFYMGAALLVKWLVIGKFEAGEINPKSDWQRFRVSLASSLFTRKKVQSVADLIGRHYENVSTLYRLLGAKVGKRVFWPGNQPTCNGMFDLLEIGDDVVFGSRSALLTASVDRFDKIILCAGANVSDNCLVMPGAVISRNAVLGSNSICPEGRFLASGSVWFGATGAESVCLEPGDGRDAMQYQRLDDEQPQGLDPLEKKKDGTSVSFVAPPVIASAVVDMSQLQMVGDETTIRPFGKAVYQGGAQGYWSLPIPAVVAYTWFWRTFCCIFHTIPLLVAVQLAAVLLYSDNIRSTIYETVLGEDGDDDDYTGKVQGEDGEVYNQDQFVGFSRDFDNGGHHHTYWDIFLAVYVSYIFSHFVRVIGWLIIELTAKWGIMGRRQPGRYNYDTSSYAQRWEMYQLTAKIRKLSRLNLLEFITGTPYMSWYFRLNGGNVGRDVCLYPAGADPMMPEPDMVTIGDRTVIDCSSVVCHLNTRGNFELVPIVIEPECTLRTQSRVQQGVHMETGSMLLEKSIAMTGEVLDKRSVWQGGPATMWFQYSESEVLVPNSYSPPTVDDDGKKDIEMGSFRLF
jgi:carbonic anhydrase/acetyltransferase-like protein (isoleucine patch superfamily)